MASAAASYAGQQQQANQQASMNALQTQSINQSRRDQQAQAQQHMGYANDQAEQQLQQNANAARAATATAATSAGENGVSGLSIDALQNEYAQRSNDFSTDVEYNRKAQDNELQWAMKGFGTESQSRINSLKQPVYPSALASGLQVAGAGLSAYSTFFPVTKSALSVQ